MPAGLDDLGASAQFRGLTPYIQKRVLEVAARDPQTPGQSHLLPKLVEASGFTKLEPRHQIAALEIFEATDTRGRTHLAEIARRQIGPPGQRVPALMDPDKDGVPMIENLRYLVDGPLASHLAPQGLTRNCLLGSVLEETARPGEIEQSFHGTCSVASMQYMLCTQNPSEYVRIMVGLASPSGQSQLRDGKLLQRVEDSVPADGGRRSPSERLFQTALMNFIDGPDWQYSNRLDAQGLDRELHVSGVKRLAGASPSTSLQGLQALFGRPFQTIEDPDAALQVLAQRSRAASDAQRQTYLALHFNKGGHAAVFERIDSADGRVYMRNSSMGRSLPRGAMLPDLSPPTRLDDPATGLISMSMADFRKALRAIQP